MIKIQDAKISDALPKVISEQPWARAMAVALGKQMQRLINYANRAQLYAAIDIMPENILDAMALDIQAPGYIFSYDIETKRTLVKTAFIYWTHAGTKAAVEELCNQIFGDSEIIEWFQNNAAPDAATQMDPFKFRVVTSSPSVTEANLDEFRSAILSIKRLSAWLDAVELAPSALNGKIYQGFTVTETTKHKFITKEDVII